MQNTRLESPDIRNIENDFEQRETYLKASPSQAHEPNLSSQVQEDKIEQLMRNHELELKEQFKNVRFDV